VDHYAKAYPIFSRIRGYRRMQEMLYSLRRFEEDDVAKERLKIIEFYKEFGEKATKQAFGADRKLIYVWKRKLKQGDNQLQSLVATSTRPIRTRTMATDPRIIEFIRDKRQKHPRIGKEKLKPLLDRYCCSISIKTISESTIGKIIKRHKMFHQKSGRAYHDPASKHAIDSLKRKKRQRVKHAPKHEDFGHFQADSLFQFSDGIRRYILSAIDSKLKFSFSACYKHLSSRAGKDFFQKLQMVYPLDIKSVQTDNGLEFLGEFEDYLKSQNILHYFTYPRCPRINGCIERYNRTLREEFLNYHLDSLEDSDALNLKLADYLIFYNTERPHKSLGLKSPIHYLMSEGTMSKKSVTYTSH
jgi:transposase InsO family protein